MDTIHDLGGMQGFGPVTVDEPEEPFHHDWEARMWAIARNVRADDWTIDWWRHIRERIDPADYLTRPYFDQWMQTHAAGFVTSGVFTVAEIASGHTGERHPPPPPESLEEVIARARRENTSFEAPAPGPARFAPGDRVRAVTDPTLGRDHHTRLPRYVRGRTGTIHAHWGSHLFADLGARGIHEGQHVYSVFFAAPDLWGGEADPRDGVHLDLWESYLEPE